MVRAQFIRTMGIIAGLFSAATAPCGLRAQSSARTKAATEARKEMAGSAGNSVLRPEPAAAPPADAAMTRVPILPPTALFPLSLNYQMWNNSAMMVDAVVDSRPQKCVLDTGLNACVVSPDLAASYPLASLPSKISVSALNETRPAPETDLKSIQFNTTKFGGLRVGILDVSEIFMGETQPDAPGAWLGTPFLSAFQVTIDYDSHVIMLNRPETALPKGKGAVTLPIELRDGHIYTQVSIPKGGKFMALVDTGAMGTLIPGSVADKLKTPPGKTFVIKQAGGKQAQAALITVPKMQIGKLEQLQVPALYFMAAAKEKNTPDRELAVLGNDFLRHYKVTLSFARQKMVLIPPPPPKLEESDAPNKAADKKPPVRSQPPVTLPGRKPNGL